MSATVVEINYAQMQQLSQRFQRQAEVVSQLQQQLNHTYQQLQNDWHGDAAKSFFNEMQTSIFPTFGKLKEVLVTAQQVTLNVNSILREAETEAANLFQGAFDGGAAAGNGKGIYEANPAGKSKLVTDPEYRKIEQPAFAQDADDSADIAIDDVKQGQLGDCYLMAGTAAIANTRPDIIRNAIRDNGDGTYTVTLYPEEGVSGFFGMRSKVEVTVTNEFVHSKGSGALGYAQLSDEFEIWPMLVEKAYAQHKGGYANIVSGNAGEFMAILTGNDSSHTDVEDVDFADLKSRLDNGAAITAGTPDSLTNKPAGVHADHAYVIKSIDPTNKTVTLYNPWGYDHPTITFDEFKANYETVSINEKD
ncbi:MAG TPA: WXG100 family type VII secretion target [Herpetosiphon sp.]|uniref:Peptidase C2 calpain n=1 Tax=Herpetosiphon aurantiacus (strain ATCC 23779 / DSM 785 / 114-95) TaxID=316274 RepID=A9B2P0_HERA2|nr:WXG100 family type VII secretion target [Herpetosiphon sp.]ABX05491.1 peptidase C2 calpain [Herpetosiphon aurantiacus DSM 785]HBW52873.1 WXG100 family type VII secretion target [Herpetosiphon sp.]